MKLFKAVLPGETEQRVVHRDYDRDQVGWVEMAPWCVFVAERAGYAQFHKSDEWWITQAEAYLVLEGVV